MSEQYGYATDIYPYESQEHLNLRTFLGRKKSSFLLGTAPDALPVKHE